MSNPPSSSVVPTLNAVQDAAGGLFKSLGTTLSPLGAKIGKSITQGRQMLQERMGAADVTELPQEWVPDAFECS